MHRGILKIFNVIVTKISGLFLSKESSIETDTRKRMTKVQQQIVFFTKPAELPNNQPAKQINPSSEQNAINPLSLLYTLI